MPYYDYQCKKCNKTVEVFKKITETINEVEQCPQCDNEMKRVWNNTMNLFKCDGSYKPSHNKE